MKYKKVCCLLSMLLVMQPQNIMAEEDGACMVDGLMAESFQYSEKAGVKEERSDQTSPVEFQKGCTTAGGDGTDQGKTEGKPEDGLPENEKTGDQERISEDTVTEADLSGEQNPEPGISEKNDTEISGPKESDPKPEEPEESDPKPEEPEESDSKPEESEESDPEPEEPEESDSKPEEPEESDPEPEEPEESVPEPEDSEESDPKPGESERSDPGDPEKSIPMSDIHEQDAIGAVPPELDISGEGVSGQVIPDSENREPSDFQAGNAEIEENNSKSPVVRIENVQPLSANSGVVAPKVIIDNLPEELGEVKLELESRSRGILDENVTVENVGGKLCLSLPELSEDDQYVLRIKNWGYGETLEQAVVFSVNQKGTTFFYDKNKSCVSVTDEFTPVIRLKNVDTTEVVSCMVNGRETPYSAEEDRVTIEQNYLREGKNQITLAVQDMAGNISVMEPWEFIVQNDADWEVLPDREASVGILERILQFFQDIIPLIISPADFWFTDR